MQFLLDSLRALDSSLAERGSRLIVVAGKSVEVVPDMGQFHPFSVST
jgi:deoxyribodipyrimidine photolyase